MGVLILASGMGLGHVERRLGRRTARTFPLLSPPLSGMTLMYLLMSAFRSAPWLKLIGSRYEARPVSPNGAI